MNKVFTFVGFEGRFPVGTAAVVVAEDLTEAEALLNDSLAEEGLPRLDAPENYDAVQVTQVDLRHQQAIILLDGDY